MEQLGVEKMYLDRISGKNTERPELRQMRVCHFSV